MPRCAVETALAVRPVSPTLAGRLVTGLSGGERQRALIAQTLAQQTPTLLLDEPLNNLDLNHQLEIMQLLARAPRRQAGPSPWSSTTSTWPLSTATSCCCWIMGVLAARGEPSALLDPRVILDVFRVRVAVHRQGQTTVRHAPVDEVPAASLAERAARGVHVIAGGGAASELIEELVLRGFTPTVGIVSVFDTDYATAQRYELEVVSAPPFQPFPAEPLQQLEPSHPRGRHAGRGARSSSVPAIWSRCGWRSRPAAGQTPW